MSKDALALRPALGVSCIACICLRSVMRRPRAEAAAEEARQSAPRQVDGNLDVGELPPRATRALLLLLLLLLLSSLVE